MSRFRIPYKMQLRSPQWLERKSEILNRDGYTCRLCDNMDLEILDVHHIGYISDGRMAWEYPDYLLVSLCRKCHQKEHDLNHVGNRQKVIQWITKLILPNPSTDSFTDEYVQAIMRGDNYTELGTDDPLVIYLSHRLKQKENG